MTVWRWTRTEYDRLVGLGAFEGCPIELIGGQLVVAESQGAYHTSAISRLEYAVRAALPDGWFVRTQAPVSLDDDSEPEPDRKSTRLNSSHVAISYAVFCLKKKKR